MVTNESSRYALKQPYIIACSFCKMAFRIENLTPHMMATRKWFCPACGSNDTTIKNNHEDDRWYAMARSFNLDPTQSNVQLLKDMYEIWEPSEYEWFKDFVLYMITTAARAVKEDR
jgi:hypothetical protein